MIGFHKMHGLGNCFIFFSELHQNLSLLKTSKAIKALCATSHGIGADGVVFIGKANDPSNQCKMEIYNSDGTEAEMCGNAIRGVAHFYDRLYNDISCVRIETRKGVREIIKAGLKNGMPHYRVQMGSALTDLVATGELAPPETRQALESHNMALDPVYINVGNPHAVIFLPNVLNHDIMGEIGAWLETHSNHPKRINVEFVELISEDRARVTVWERGCGFTEACGTGATAVTAAGIIKNHFRNKAVIEMPGGELFIEKENELFYMTGAIQEVASGQLSVSFVAQITKP